MRPLALLLTTTVLVACGSGTGESEPQDAVRGLLTAFAAGDCADAQAHVTRPSDLTCSQVKAVRAMLDEESVDVDEVTLEVGDRGKVSATVLVDFHDGEDPQPYDVVSLDGEWLVELDSPA